MVRDKIQLGIFTLARFSVSIFNKLCKLYIKRLLCAALNSNLNGFAPREEIFSKNPSRREGHYCFNPLTGSHFKTEVFLEAEIASCLPLSSPKSFKAGRDCEGSSLASIRDL